MLKRGTKAYLTVATWMWTCDNERWKYYPLPLPYLWAEQIEETK